MSRCLSQWNSQCCCDKKYNNASEFATEISYVGLCCAVEHVSGDTQWNANTFHGDPTYRQVEIRSLNAITTIHRPVRNRLCTYSRYCFILVTGFGLCFVGRVITLFQWHIGFAPCYLEIKMLNCTFTLIQVLLKVS